ncbi:MAG: hypothetical protein J0L70_01995 [Leptolyngbya sp. UWPOB_LEPTO1]|uniref:hypothetical protein n=1 Tax=Leptolyngbya sp. UWPOB_LEPTO1 TaxID=2815653 RepID=UPI001AD49CAD|nr:hypothetical protein [Leptolyngbya sp. UWPOB_LEPTO1]MBN8559276.1 hypothetical protein [Leptolyngbya sp. UWPOB_LEPTO1]
MTLIFACILLSDQSWKKSKAVCFELTLKLHPDRGNPSMTIAPQSFRYSVRLKFKSNPQVQE